MNRMIIPFQGIGNYKLYSSEESIKNQLANEKEKFVEEEWNNEDHTDPFPWKIIRTESNMNFFFAKNKLFKIYVENGFDGSLECGITIGTPMDEVFNLDPEIKYNDWDEDWISPKGYWIEDDIESNTVVTITIFIKELLDDKLFEKYEW